MTAICRIAICLLADLQANGQTGPVSAPPATVVPIDGIKISRDTVLAPGTHVLETGLEIVADGITLDGNGAVLIGRDQRSTSGHIRGD